MKPSFLGSLGPQGGAHGTLGLMGPGFPLGPIAVPRGPRGGSWDPRVPRAGPHRDLGAQGSQGDGFAASGWGGDERFL